MSEVRVYSASAGAGKTFRLTCECLQLLIENPHDYKHLLAVTFTNKASEEMKERLVNELYVLASGQSSGYLKHLQINSESNADSEKFIRSRALQALTLILHDYGRFSYMTIDSFFQKILRAFMHEMNLNANYNLELDSNAVVHEAVDQLIEETAVDTELLNWVLDVVKVKMNESGRWDFREELIALFKELYKEKFAVINEQYRLQQTDKNKVRQLIAIVKELKKKHTDYVNSIAGDADDILKKYGFTTDDFSYKSAGAIASMLKLNKKNKIEKPGQRFYDALDDAETCIGKGNLHKANIRSAFSELNALMHQFNDWIQSDFAEYTTCNLLLNNMYLLGLVVDGKQRLNALMAANDSFFIGDTPLFLSDLSRHNDTPFIYEKTGIRLKHYLIDEFQDTSEKQWEAFLPLLRESLSYGKNLNMVVGDVKQSIFRWRNGNWRILAEQIHRQLHVQALVLKENYRSAQRIVEFNNSLFLALAERVQHYINNELPVDGESSYDWMHKTIIDNYSDVAQNPMAGEGGCVSIRFMPEELKVDEWKTLSMQYMAAEIVKLMHMGYAPGDIAVLVRTNKDAKRVVSYLLDYQQGNENHEQMSFSVVSAESLNLASNPAVSVLINLLSYVAQPSNSMALFNASVNYSLHIRRNTQFSDFSVSAEHNQLLKAFPAELVSLLTQSVHGDLVSLCEHFIRVGELNKKNENTAFLDAFVELAADFSARKGTGVMAFIEWWQNEGCTKSLSLPDSNQAVKILTIHQAKGLGFEAVFIPFGNFDLTPEKNPLLWCNTENTAFSIIPYVPVTYKSEMAESLFVNEYFEEMLHFCHDSLNLFYVAATRAKKVLWMGMPLKKSKSLADYTREILKKPNSATDNRFIDLSKYFDGTELFEYGSIPEPKYYYKPGIIMPEHNVSENKKQVITHSEFTKKFAGEAMGDIQKGILLHSVFEKIRGLNDIQPAVEQLLNNGYINNADMDAHVTYIHNLLSNTNVKPWFTEFDNLHNEAWILSPDGNMNKPDRVMQFGNSIEVLDYKFGLKTSDKHISQIKTYMQLLNDMGYENCKGFVWYVSLNKIVQVDDRGNKTIDW